MLLNRSIRRLTPRRSFSVWTMGNKSSAPAGAPITETSAPILAQNALLNTFCGDTCYIESKTLDLANGHMNYIEVVSKQKRDKLVSGGVLAKKKEKEKVLVLTHGYGSGIGFFYPNLHQLACIYDRVIAFDWLGMGGSARNVKSELPIRGWLNCRQMTGTKASDFFIDHLEEFRSALQLEDFVLAGHSLGGYLAGRYALKYPTHLQGLVLISPAGIPPHPPAEMHVKTADLSLRMRTIQNAWSGNFTPQVGQASGFRLLAVISSRTCV